ncbi:hypothetical protein [Anaeromicropila populeti]|nr:hypothetical protein [Anaeromicropila populeti]
MGKLLRGVFVVGDIHSGVYLKEKYIDNHKGFDVTANRVKAEIDNYMY